MMRIHIIYALAFTLGTYIVAGTDVNIETKLNEARDKLKSLTTKIKDAQKDKKFFDGKMVDIETTKVSKYDEADDYVGRSITMKSYRLVEYADLGTKYEWIANAKVVLNQLIKIETEENRIRRQIRQKVRSIEYTILSPLVNERNFVAHELRDLLRGQYYNNMGFDYIVTEFKNKTNALDAVVKDFLTEIQNANELKRKFNHLILFSPEEEKIRAERMHLKRTLAAKVTECEEGARKQKAEQIAKGLKKHFQKKEEQEHESVNSATAKESKADVNTQEAEQVSDEAQSKKIEKADVQSLDDKVEAVEPVEETPANPEVSAEEQTMKQDDIKSVAVSEANEDKQLAEDALRKKEEAMEYNVMTAEQKRMKRRGRRHKKNKKKKYTNKQTELLIKSFGNHNNYSGPKLKVNGEAILTRWKRGIPRGTKVIVTGFRPDGNTVTVTDLKGKPISSEVSRGRRQIKLKTTWLYKDCLMAVVKK